MHFAKDSAASRHVCAHVYFVPEHELIEKGLYDLLRWTRMSLFAKTSAKLDQPAPVRWWREAHKY